MAATLTPAEGSKRKRPQSRGSQPKKKRLTPAAGQPAPSVPSASTAPKAIDDIVKADFMPLDTTADQKYVSKRGKKSKVISVSNSAGSGQSAVIYVGRIPHGFYEDQMRGFFSQFGDIKRLRLSRNKKTGNSKHYAFIEFESSEVAPIVADAMHNYLLFESMLQVKVVPLEQLKPSMWVGANKPFRIIEWQKLERKRHNRVRTPKEQSRQLGLLVKKDRKRRKKLQDAGIDYDYPELKAIIPRTSKRTTFNDNDD